MGCPTVQTGGGRQTRQRSRRDTPVPSLSQNEHSCCALSPTTGVPDTRASDANGTKQQKQGDARTTQLAYP
eukprot:6348024-Pyramimonas_sp.AAC.1